MKKELYFGIVGVIAVLILAGYYAGQYSGKKANPAVGNTQALSNLSDNTVALTTAEVLKHGDRSDCWLIMNGSVYNVTGYLNSHPGGVAGIVQYCGRDATQGYDTKGGRGTMHSGMADRDLRQLLIGALNATVNSQQVQNTNSVYNFSGGDDD
ncbi:MAG: cytochrome b5-like heme/steroid binding domain-containing protein [Patescibacteria group bacterium]|jgi:cytochrome b involved in lipid metabolism